MNILTTHGWNDYQLLDSGNQMRLERFGQFIIAKPDPQAIWKPKLSESNWSNAHAIFKNGNWQKNSTFPQKWILKYNEMSFYAKLTPFKHTGIFPEQIINWEYIENKLNQSNAKITKPKVLNLFAYTGIASLIAANQGALVTHLDASKPSIAWAKENQELSGLNKDSIRWILDDAIEFTSREIRRGSFYDAIIMDPPVYGHGPNGQLWDFNISFQKLLENCSKILVKDPIFVIANAYAVSSSAIMLKNLFEDYFQISNKNLEYGELTLIQQDKRMLSTGIFARFSSY